MKKLLKLILAVLAIQASYGDVLLLPSKEFPVPLLLLQNVESVVQKNDYGRLISLKLYRLEDEDQDEDQRRSFSVTAAKELYDGMEVRHTWKGTVLANTVSHDSKVDRYLCTDISISNEIYSVRTDMLDQSKLQKEVDTFYELPKIKNQVLGRMDSIRLDDLLSERNRENIHEVLGLGENKKISFKTKYSHFTVEYRIESGAVLIVDYSGVII